MYKSNRYHLYEGLHEQARLEESFIVSYRVASTGKPHTIVEDLILPAAADMAGTMLGGKAPKTIDNAFIKQHCFTTHQ